MDVILRPKDVHYVTSEMNTNDVYIDNPSPMGEPLKKIREGIPDWSITFHYSSVSNEYMRSFLFNTEEEMKKAMSLISSSLICNPKRFVKFEAAKEAQYDRSKSYTIK